MKGQLIGQGNTAEVFAWGDNEILKLYRGKFPKEGIEGEFYVSKAVEKLNLPVPKTGQMIELEGRAGIVYERITGSSMLEQLMKTPFSIGKFAKQMAELHYQVHQCKVMEFPKVRDRLIWNIQHTQLTEQQKAGVLDILEHLPEDIALCHGDFHPGNIIVNSEKYVIIDWGAAASGNPAADVARTLMLLQDAVLPEYIPVPKKLAINLVRHRMAKLYLKHYRKLSGISKNEITDWRVVMLSARLMEWVPDKEKTAILKELDQALSKVHKQLLTL